MSYKLCDQLQHLSKESDRAALQHACHMLRVLALPFPLAAGRACRHATKQAHNGPVFESAAEAHCRQTPPIPLEDSDESALILAKQVGFGSSCTKQAF